MLVKIESVWINPDFVISIQDGEFGGCVVAMCGESLEFDTSASETAKMLNDGEVFTIEYEPEDEP